MKKEPVQIKPWRESPFKIGKRYQVRNTFEGFRDSFTKGEVLTFNYDAWSRYDAITGYFFKQTKQDTIKVWDIQDDEDIQVWKELFVELPEN